MHEEKTLREQVEAVVLEARPEAREAALRVVELTEQGVFDDLEEWAEVGRYLRFNLRALADSLDGEARLMREFAEQATLPAVAVVSEVIRTLGDPSGAPLEYVRALAPQTWRLRVALESIGFWPSRSDVEHVPPATRRKAVRGILPRLAPDLLTAAQWVITALFLYQEARSAMAT